MLNPEGIEMLRNKGPGGGGGTLAPNNSDSKIYITKNPLN